MRPRLLVGVLLLAGGCAGAGSGRGATLIAEPDPIPVCGGGIHGRTRISWFREGMGLTQVRLRSSDGELVAEGQGHGSVWTGEWVTDGLRFYLVDAASGEVLAETRVRVVEDCP